MEPYTSGASEFAANVKSVDGRAKAFFAAIKREKMKSAGSFLNEAGVSIGVGACLVTR